MSNLPLTQSRTFGFFFSFNSYSSHMIIIVSCYKVKYPWFTWFFKNQTMQTKDRTLELSKKISNTSHFTEKYWFIMIVAWQQVRNNWKDFSASGGNQNYDLLNHWTSRAHGFGCLTRFSLKCATGTETLIWISFRMNPCLTWCHDDSLATCKRIEK